LTGDAAAGTVLAMGKNNSKSKSVVRVSPEVAPKVSRAAAVRVAAPTHEEIATRAFTIYLAEGCPDGRHLDHWSQAESELGLE
jgi:uncharacterized metal-binding protein